jgi:hypothetical protein
MAARAPARHAAPAISSRRRPARLLARAALLAGLAIVAFLSFGVGVLLSLPDVGDARARVARILVEHHCVPSSEVGSRLGAAVVAAEDEHFHSNFAVDLLDGIGRAALATVQGGGDPGGSTITQQLAKQLYGDGGGLGGTLADIGLAVKLSLRYSKQQILAMYLNAVYYGNGYWGEVAAARGYFGTAPQRLDWPRRRCSRACSRRRPPTTR